MKHCQFWHKITVFCAIGQKKIINRWLAINRATPDWREATMRGPVNRMCNVSAPDGSC